MKLVKEMEDLHENLNSLKELEAKQPKPTFRSKISNFFKRKPKDSANDAQNTGGVL